MRLTCAIDKTLSTTGAMTADRLSGLVVAIAHATARRDEQSVLVGWERGSILLWASPALPSWASSALTRIASAASPVSTDGKRADVFACAIPEGSATLRACDDESSRAIMRAVSDFASALPDGGPAPTMFEKFPLFNPYDPPEPLSVDAAALMGRALGEAAGTRVGP